MKKIIIILCLVFLSSSAWCAEYVHIDDPDNIRSLPNKWTFADGNKTGNFRLMSSSVLIAEGWREITANNSAVYDPAIQTVGNWVVTIINDVGNEHAEKTRTVTDKPLEDVQAARKKNFQDEAAVIYKSKWNVEYRLMGIYTTEEVTQMDADRDTLFNYYRNVLELAIDGATNNSEVQGVTATWPTI